MAAHAPRRIELHHEPAVVHIRVAQHDRVDPVLQVTDGIAGETSHPDVTVDVEPLPINRAGHDRYHAGDANEAAVAERHVQPPTSPDTAVASPAVGAGPDDPIT